jgi:archaellum component FlaC
MNEKKSTAQLREKIRNLKLKNQNLEKLILHRANEFEKTKSTLEEQVAQRTLSLREQKERLQAITENVPGVNYMRSVSLVLGYVKPIPTFGGESAWKRRKKQIMILKV